MNSTTAPFMVQPGCGKSHRATATLIYFSDFFSVPTDVLEEYGAINISLINDLPLFIDPFLLFDSEDEHFQALHEEIIRYVRFLRDVAVDPTISRGLLDHWFRFPEVSQNWLGFSKTGNKGSGLGGDFAAALQRNLHNVFKNFGAETVTSDSHLEKLCLLGDGVGRDHLSDFTTNLIKGYLLDYTQRFSREHIDPRLLRRFAVSKVHFDYTSHRWRGDPYDLPAFADDFVILSPKSMLTKDEAWINRSDLLTRFDEIYTAMPDDQLRGQVNAYFLQRLSEVPLRKNSERRQVPPWSNFPRSSITTLRRRKRRGLKRIPSAARRFGKPRSSSLNKFEHWSMTIFGGQHFMNSATALRNRCAAYCFSKR
jgi:hypothetical protein